MEASFARSFGRTPDALYLKFGDFLVLPVDQQKSVIAKPILKPHDLGNSFGLGQGMQAEIISIGTEILLGEIQDTNARFLAEQLPALGIDLYYMHQIGDNLPRIAELIRSAMKRSDLVICSGGLGPTEDDVTREAIGDALGEELTLVPKLETQLRAWFAQRSYPMSERNLKQATLIPSAGAIHNPRGTAPGWWVEKEGKVVVALPGPPAELIPLWKEAVAPRLRDLASGSVIVSRTLKTAGVGEGSVDELAGDLLNSANPSIGVYARADGVHLRITAKAPDTAAAYRLIRPLEEEVRNRFGTALWGADDDTLPGIVGSLLKENGLSVAVMESCTGGLLAGKITENPGSSDYFRGGVVAYTAKVKQAFGVPSATLLNHGVVSEATARAMATSARGRFQADIGVGLTGVAGPEPHGEQQVGTIHIGIETSTTSGHRSYVFGQTRVAVRNRAVLMALMLIRRAVLGELESKTLGAGGTVTE